MRTTLLAAGPALLAAAVLMGCASSPGATTSSESSAAQESDPTIEELRHDVTSVVTAVHPLILHAEELDQLLLAVDTMTPAPCAEDGSWRLTPSFKGAGIKDPEAFIPEAESVLAELGIPSDESRRNGVVGTTAYVSAKSVDGRLIAIEAGSGRTLVQYETVCSTDPSLRAASRG